MQTHKYVAATMKEAIARIKEELGDDALILKSEKVKAGGRVGALRQEMIEITAAKAEDVHEEAQVGPEFAETLDRTLSRPPAAERSPESGSGLSEITDEVKRLREDLTDFAKAFRYNQMANMPRALTSIYERMSESGINRDWATELAHDALLRMGVEDLTSSHSVENFLLSRVSGVVRPSPTPAVRFARSYKIMLVGSPGAGKTTLIQKLASDPAAYGKRKVGLISLDTHRMAAIEQLRTFARIAGLPLEIVFQPDHASNALAQINRSQIILIDTPGCTATDSEKLSLLQQFVEKLDPDEIHLVLNSSVRDEEMAYAGRRFRDIGITHLSFTRIDESLRHGYLLNIAKTAERPIGWLSHGQGFVGCIERFTPDHLRRWIALSEPIDETILESSMAEQQTVDK